MECEKGEKFQRRSGKTAKCLPKICQPKSIEKCLNLEKTFLGKEMVEKQNQRLTILRNEVIASNENTRSPTMETEMGVEKRLLNENQLCHQFSICQARFQEKMLSPPLSNQLKKNALHHHFHNYQSWGYMVMIGIGAMLGQHQPFSTFLIKRQTHASRFTSVHY